MSTNRRVYLHTSEYNGHWWVQYLEEDLRTSFCRRFRYSSVDPVREILRRVNADTETLENFEKGLRCWGIGACFINLTEEQYAKLKQGRVSRNMGCCDLGAAIRS